MQPLFDMLKGADQGRGMELLARQFDLSKQQAELAVEALLPAFSEGMKRSAADPFGVSAFLGTMASGGHAQYFEDAARAFTPAGMTEGNNLLAQLFGSPDLSRAISEQAARMTGLSQDVLKQIMPALAAMLMGGLSKAAAAPDASGPFAEMMRQWVRAGTAMQPGRAADSAGPFDNPVGRAMTEMFGGAKPASAAPSQGFDNPFAKMFEAMTPGQHGAQAATPPDFYSAVSQMFETGRKGREDYEKAMSSLFDQFAKGVERSPEN